MTAFLSFEWLKLTRRWMPRIILILLLGLTAVVFWGQGSRPLLRPNLFLPRGWLAALSFVSFFAPFFWPVLGGSWAGNEYGWGTIRTVLTRRPYRIEHVAAALLVLLVAVGLSLLAILLVATAGGLVVSLVTGNDLWESTVWSGGFLSILLQGFLTAWFLSAFYLILSYAAATVFQSAAVGIGLGIGATLAQIVLTGILASLGGVWNDIALQFPFRYTRDMITQVVHGGMVPGTSLARLDPGTPSALQSFLVLAAYVVVFLIITGVAVRSRDVTA